MKKTLSNTSIRAIAISLLFIFSGIGASVLISPATALPNSAAAAAPVAAAAPLTAAQANWLYPDGNSFNWSFNPQTQINSSNAQYLGLNWLYPLPSKPSALVSLAATGNGVGMAVLISNGTAFATTLFDETIAFNVANGNVLWTFTAPLLPNSTTGLNAGTLSLHSHDGNELMTTATMGKVSGPTLWYQGEDFKAYALNALTGAVELSFLDFTGNSMVPGNSPTSIYRSIGASNLLIDQPKGILISGHDAESAAINGRGFFAGWNLNNNPPTLMWVAYTTPPQPNSNVPLNPSWAIQDINNMSSAWTFYPAVAGSTNGYTTPAEVAGGLLTPTAANPLVVNWKTMSPTQLNSTLYNDWGQSNQSAQCLAIDGGGSTGSTGSGWGGPWLLGSGQSNGMAFVTTNNKDPFTGPCNPGPDLWSASILALNVTNGHWMWAAQTTAHDIWDYDCSWWQGMANETISGVNTEVILKTCKNGYLYQINAVTGALIWAWSPPTSLMPRCPICYVPDPTNKTQMSFDFPTAFTTWKGGAPTTGPQPPFLQYPSELAGFEDEQTYSPTLNYLFAAAHIVPYFMTYFGINASTYATTTGESGTPVNKGTCSDCSINNNNATVFALNAQTGATVWHYFIPEQGYRGGITNSGNMVFATLSSGDFLMINAAQGTLTRDYYIGAPMDQIATVGASVAGQESIIIPVGTCGNGGIATCPGTTPGDIIALTLENVPAASVATTTVTATSTATSTTTVGGVTQTVTAGGVTSTVTVGAGQTATVTVGGVTTTITGAGTTATATVTSTASGTSSGVSSTTLYGVAAVAVIFIIATGYLAMRGRKPAS